MRAAVKPFYWSNNISLVTYSIIKAHLTSLNSIRRLQLVESKLTLNALSCLGKGFSNSATSRKYKYLGRLLLEVLLSHTILLHVVYNELQDAKRCWVQCHLNLVKRECAVS